MLPHSPNRTATRTVGAAVALTSAGATPQLVAVAIAGLTAGDALAGAIRSFPAWSQAVIPELERWRAFRTRSRRA